MADPIKKVMLDTNTGIQKDFPKPRCLIVLRVLKLKMLRRAAIDANTTSKNKAKVQSAIWSFGVLCEKSLVK